MEEDPPAPVPKHGKGKGKKAQLEELSADVGVVNVDADADAVTEEMPHDGKEQVESEIHAVMMTIGVFSHGH